MTTQPANDQNPTSPAWKSATVYHDRESANARSTSGYAYSWRFEIIAASGQSILGGYYPTHEEATAAMDLTLCRLSAEARSDREVADIRYEYSTCATCGQLWQNIDFGCARHMHSCSNPMRAEARQ